MEVGGQLDARPVAVGVRDAGRVVDVVEVRRARVGDVDRVVACQAACWQEAYADIVPPSYLGGDRVVAERRDRWSRRIAGGRRVMVAEDAGEIVGVGSARPREDPDVDIAVELASLYVRRSRWRGGVGTRLLDALIAGADAYLWVFEQNQQARDFYTRRGFHPDGAGKLDAATGLWEIRMVRRATPAASRLAAAGLVDYESDVDDNARWADFALRGDDIVVSTRSKSGTTWMQMICALLVHGPELPAALPEISPWLEHLVVPQDAMFARLASQRHRRVIKTHTPLDGVPSAPGVTYIVVARQPLDMAVSLYHQGANLDRARVAELAGQPRATPDPKPRPALRDWLLTWIESDADPRTSLDSLPGVLAHIADARRRSGGRDVVVVRYEDLLSDLEGQMHAVAARLGIGVDAGRWPTLVEAATLDGMRRRLDVVVPDTGGIFKDRSAFFRRGAAGAGREILTDAEFAAYRQRVRELSDAELDAWLHADG